MPKLNQVVAIEKGVKSRSHSEISEVYKKLQKPVLFNGLSKTYQPKDEDGETYPQENQKVQESVVDILRTVEKTKTELFDVTAQKDYGNTTAKADVVLPDGTVIVKDAPVPYLLFLEKELTDLRTLVSAIPVLDSTDDWSADNHSGLYKTDAVKRNSTKKVQKALVLYPATDKHPAQTQLITEDVTVGVWEQVKYSGALGKPDQEALVERVEALLNAVKFAREEANNADAPKVNVGEAIFDYILGN